MRRWIPEVGALYERVRRPATMILLGLALMVPAGSWLSVRGEPVAASAQEAALAGPVEAKVAVAREAAGPIAGPWKKKALAREGRAVAARFAREFDIPLTLAQKIHGAAVAEEIEPRVAFGLVLTESSFRRTAVSHVGAVGYTQVLPSTARWLVPGTSRSDLFEADTNLRIGFKYLKYLEEKYDGNMRLALTAYNRGPGTVDRLLRHGRNPENGYAEKVLRRRV